MRARFTARFIPISFMIKASGNIEEFKRQSQPVIKNFIKNILSKKKADDERLSFSWNLEFKNRNNQKVKKSEMLEAIKDVMEFEAKEAVKGSQNEINFYTEYQYADYDFLIEVYRDIMMFGICKDYKTLKKYNL